MSKKKYTFSYGFSTAPYMDLKIGEPKQKARVFACKECYEERKDWVNDPFYGQSKDSCMRHEKQKLEELLLNQKPLSTEEPKQDAICTEHGRNGCLHYLKAEANNNKLIPKHEHCAPSLNNWEEEYDKENWHSLEGANGICACSEERGNCHKRLKQIIASQINLAIQKERQRIEYEVLKLKEPVDKIQSNMDKKKLPGIAIAREIKPRVKYNSAIDDALSIVNKGVEEK